MQGMQGSVGVLANLATVKETRILLQRPAEA